MPHKVVFLSIKSWWEETVLTWAGVDVKIFKAHSTKAASISKANVTCISLEEILEEAVSSGHINIVLSNRRQFEPRGVIWIPARLSMVFKNSVLDWLYLYEISAWNDLRMRRSPKRNSNFMTEIWEKI